MTWLHPHLSQLLETSDSGVWGDEDPSNGISVLRSTNIENDGSISFDNLAFRDVPTKKREEKLLRAGDIILENSGGGPKQPVGRVSYFAGDEREHVVGNFCRRLRPVNEIVNPRFLFWRLFHGHLIGDTLRYQTQTTGLRNLQFKSYAEQKIELPTLSEQRRIVELLDQADVLRRLRCEADAKAARILPALFLKMFGDPTTNPMRWPVEPLNDITNPKQWPTISSKELTESGYPVFGANGVIGYYSTYNHEYPTVLITCRGATCGTINICTPKSYVTGNAMALDDPDPKKTTIEFLEVYLNVRGLDDAITGAAQPQITRQNLQKVNVFVPPDALVKKFSEQARAIKEMLSRASTGGDQVENILSLLLQRAFSGQLTANWRQAHMQELLAEMQQQAKVLNLSASKEIAA